MRVSTGLIIIAGSLVVANCSTTQSNPIYQQTTKYQSSAPTMVQQASYETQTPASIRYVDSPTSNHQVQTASYTRINQECVSKEANREIVGTLAGGVIGAVAGRKLAGDNKTVGTLAGGVVGGLVGHGIADKTINCDPITVPVATSGNTAQTIAAITPAYQPLTQNAGAYRTYTSQSLSGQSVLTPAAITKMTIEENTSSFGTEGTPGYYAMQETAAPQQAQRATLAPVLSPMVTTPIPQQPAMIEQASSSALRHTIVPGDTVYSLARQSCVSVTELKTANNINNDFYIRVGDEIMIPLSKCVE